MLEILDRIKVWSDIISLNNQLIIIKSDQWMGLNNSYTNYPFRNILSLEYIKFLQPVLPRSKFMTQVNFVNVHSGDQNLFLNCP